MSSSSFGWWGKYSSEGPKAGNAESFRGSAHLWHKSSDVSYFFETHFWILPGLVLSLISELDHRYPWRSTKHVIQLIVNWWLKTLVCLFSAVFSMINHKPILYFQVEMMIIIHGKITFRSYWLQLVTVGFVPSILLTIYTWNKDFYYLHSSMRTLRYRKTRYLSQGNSKFQSQFPSPKTEPLVLTSWESWFWRGSSFLAKGLCHIISTKMFWQI